MSPLEDLTSDAGDGLFTDPLAGLGVTLGPNSANGTFRTNGATLPATHQPTPGRLTMIRGIGVSVGTSFFVLLWLAIGVLATYQRGYFEGSPQSCAKTGTVAVTVVSGPLNYVGVNPQVTCELPITPSK